MTPQYRSWALSSAFSNAIFTREDIARFNALARKISGTRDRLFPVGSSRRGEALMEHMARSDTPRPVINAVLNAGLQDIFSGLRRTVPNETAEDLRSIAACIENREHDDDWIAGGETLVEGLRRIATQLEQPITVGITCEGGLVQSIRADSPTLRVIVADKDSFDTCGGGVTGPCEPDEEREDIEDHNDHRNRLRIAQTLPHDIPTGAV